MIELLVVMGIIGILMGLLFSGAQQALNSAKKTTAKNQAVQITAAINAYETEYGQLPSNGTATNVGANLVNILCTTNDTNNNPRAIIFLESSAWAKGKGGTNSSGFCDPWSNVYSVALDTNYINQLSNMPSQSNVGVAPTYGTTLTLHVGVWTVWTNSGRYYLINSWN